MSATQSARGVERLVEPPSRLGWAVRRRLFQAALSNREINFDNFFQNDTVAVYPALGVILNRVKKSGNTTLVAFFDELDRARGSLGPAPCTTKEVKACRRPHLMPFARIPQVGVFATLVTVRNPYHRAISGFLDKIAGGNDPVYQDYPCYGDSSPRAFESFLRHCAERDFFGNRHFFPQTRLLIQPVARFTQVARLETLETDVDAFLTRLGHPPRTAAPLASPHPLEMREANKVQGSTEKEYYLTKTARVSDQQSISR